MNFSNFGNKLHPRLYLWLLSHINEVKTEVNVSASSIVAMPIKIGFVLLCSSYLFGKK